LHQKPNFGTTGHNYHHQNGSPMPNRPLPTHHDVLDAANVLEGLATRTPLLEFDALNQELHGRILIKPETFQRTGSFKFRGAYNKLSRIPKEKRSAGVVAWSSGNHAQGVADAAKLLGMPATIVMPKDAPKIKVENTKALGAKIVFFDRYTESREDIGEQIAEETGATIVPSYDDPEIIAGQGTVGLEIATDAKALAANLDAVLICCGGGGLSSGSSLAIKHLSPQTSIYCVEPEHYDDHALSLEQGHRVTADITRKSICDALLTPTPGELTFEINRVNLAGGLVVSEQDVRSATKFAFETLKLVVEPGGAVALAAALSGQFDCRDKTVALVLSGANVDAGQFATIITESN
jgi:threonine dehydratase